MVRKRPQQYRVDNAEDRAVSADTQRQRDDGDQSEAGVSPQHPRPITQVLPQVLQPPRPARVAAPLLHLLRTAESEPGPPSRFLRIKSLRDEIGRMLVQMKAQFFFELLFHLLSEPQSTPPSHLAPPSDILRIRLTASVNRCQLAASVSSCARPFRVRR